MTRVEPGSLKDGRYHWVIHPEQSAASRELAGAARISALTAQALLNRKVTSAQEAQSFLSPSMEGLPDPQTLPDMADGVERIRRAITDGEKIVIHGDYDVDGLAGSAILAGFLETLGHAAHIHIPNRLTDGYGMRPATVSALADEGVKLIVTVDTGTSAREAIACARERGVDVVVTDHHEPPPELPEGVPVINPKRRDSAYPCRNLAGAGVAFHLAWALAVDISGKKRVRPELRAFLLEALALVALGTIADVVPLLAVNRILVAEGLRSLEATKHPGLTALLETCRLAARRIQPRDVSFQIAPRLNAAGRMGHPDLAREILTTRSPGHAAELARELDRTNRERRSTEARVLEQALAELEGIEDLEECPVVVLGGPDWHLGVIGIVASRLVDRLGRPAILVSFDAAGRGRGSGRSVEGFDLYAALDRCGGHLVRYGGHAGAAGFEIERERMEGFSADLRQTSAEGLKGVSRPTLQVDMEVELEELSAGVLEEFERLQPCGAGNPAPLVCCRGLEVAGQPRRVGATGDHVSFQARQSGHVLKAIAFGQGALAEHMRERPFDAVLRPFISEWQGRRQVEVEVKDLRWSTPEA